MKTDFIVKTVRENKHGKFVVVDREKATYKGVPVKDLGAFGRRKFENLLIMNSHQKLGGAPKIRYE